MRTLSVAAIRRERRRNGEKGFTLIELLVVVTIIGILAAIVSVSVGGFTGQATVKSRKTSLATVQTAVDVYSTDNAAGDGTAVAPTSTNKLTIAQAAIDAASTDFYGTNGKTPVAFSGSAGVSADATFDQIDLAKLTGLVTTTIGNSATTRGPYLRGTSNAIICVFAGNTNALKGDNTTSTQYKIIACKDSGT